MIDTQAIRNKILDLALRGQLTEQLPEDGTAEELYQQIQRERVQLSKAGELYREKSVKAIIPKDIPYPIHEHWLWVRLGELSKVITKGSSPKWQGVNYTDADNGILFVTSENVGNGQMLFEKRKYVQKQFNEMHPASILQRGDILTNIVGGSIGRTALFDEETNCANTNQAVCIIRLVDRSISDYILHYLCSDNAISIMLGKVVDTARANLSLTSVSNLMVPLPPLAEQQRIVEIIDQAFSILDTIDALQAQYADNLTALKAKLIDAAIQGKLTEQLPDDGTAEELYEKIQEEKQALIKAGKIKKEKPLPEITADEIPFEIPEHWKWCRIGDIFTLQAGKNITTGSIQNHPDSDNRYPCYGGNGLRGYVNQFNVNGLHALIGRQGALCGNINFASGKFYATEHAVVVYEYSGTNMQWAGLTLRALNLNQYATSVAQPGLAVNKINKVLIPLPPLAEQKRIAHKIEELMPLFEK